MRTYKCLSGNNKQTINKFLNLPKEIYSKDLLPQDYKTEKEILNGTHTLSPNIKVYPFVMVGDTGTTYCRCLLTYYNNDPVAYLGFFEAHNNKSAVREMFMQVERKVRADGKKKIVGPIDASIYINYRFKTNKFDEVYTGEPYNQPYYKELWEYAGFTTEVKYVSNKLRKVEEADIDPQLERIYKRYVNKGYQFISPTDETFGKCLRDVYGVMMNSYSDFPGFKKLTECQFVKMFSNIKALANYEMMKLVYKDNKLHAFAIAIPNYGDLTRGKMTLGKLLKIKRIKKKPSEYVILYVGADKTAGLGSALLHHIRNILFKNQCTSITALIREGNLTGKLYSDLYIDQFEYVLMSKTT